MNQALKKLYSEINSELETSNKELQCEEEERLLSYLKLIQSWNEKMDLVSPASGPVLMERHLLDSLACYLLIFQHYKIARSASIIDIGSGAGLPGVVFSIMQPNRKVYLSEPREKRCHFLKEVRRELGLKELEVVCVRMEDLAELTLTEPGLIVSRAIPKNCPFIKLASELLPPGGLAAQMLGPSFKTGHNELKVYDYELPISKTPRKLAIYQKCFT